MNQNVFGGRALPGPTGGAYSIPPDPTVGLRGGVGKEKGGRGWKREGKKERGGPTPTM